MGASVPEREHLKLTPSGSLVVEGSLSSHDVTWLHTHACTIASFDVVVSFSQRWAKKTDCTKYKQRCSNKNIKKGGTINVSFTYMHRFVVFLLSVMKFVCFVYLVFLHPIIINGVTDDRRIFSITIIHGQFEKDKI